VTRIVRFAVGHPKSVIGTWLAVVAVLGVLGLRVEGSVTPSDIRVEATEAERWLVLREGHYGADVFVMLEGPRAAIDRQGHALTRELRKLPDVRVLSPWDGPAAEQELRFGRERLILAVDATAPEDEPVFEAAPRVQEAADAVVEEPVEGYVTGPAAISVALNETVISATRSAEKLALPILVIVLLFIFRSPIAASIPLMIAVGTLACGFGLLEIVTSWRTVDAIALSTTSMIGLALGVDYSLLIVSRFREVLAEGDRDKREAALSAGRTAGRTAVFAGGVLLTVMSVPLLLSPGTILFSAALGAMVVAAVSMIASVLVTPAVLALLGHNVNRWRIGKGSGAGLGSFATERFAKRPALVAALILGLLLAMSVPALGSKMDAPDPGQLPDGNEARDAFETVSRAVGPGWSAALDVALDTGGAPLTDPRTLKALDEYQEKLSDLPNVRLVVGPGALEPAGATLRRIPIRITGITRELERRQNGTLDLEDGAQLGLRGAQQIRRGTQRASRGAFRLSDGVQEAVDGAGLLTQGATRGARGAGRLANGLGLAVDGAGRLTDGLERAQSGAARLADGTSQAKDGVSRLTAGVRKAREGAAKIEEGALTLATGLEEGASQLERLHEPVRLAESELEKAFDDLQAMTTGKTDPRYASATLSVGTALGAISGRHPVTGEPVDPEYRGLDREITRAVDGAREAGAGAREIADGAAELERGLARIERGTERLQRGSVRLHDGQLQLVSGLMRLNQGADRASQGLMRLASGSARLASGIGQLAQGSGTLTSGLMRLDTGMEELARGLAEGRSRAAPLAAGLELMANAVRRLERTLDSPGLADADVIRRRVPHIFRSGFLPLAAVDGARADDRRRARTVLDFEAGGQSGRVLVVPKTAPNDPKTRELVDRLRVATADLRRVSGLDAAVGGTAAQAADYLDAMSSALPLLVGLIVLLTFLGLLPIVRAVPLALLAVVLNLLTVGAAVGVLTLTFVGDDPLLGGPGAIDVVAMTTIFAITFALSIDYEVFLLTRMREEWDRSHDPTAAISYGLQGTASVVTGAAVIMLGVFTAFSLSGFVTLRQFGVGLGVAVLLDATVVRLVLLPALMRLLGERAWWMPGWLDRLLPNIEVEASDDEPPARSEGHALA
jgi:RND superfamily putative drug exporter